MNVTITSSKDVAVNFEAKGGAMAKVEGAAMLTLKGGMVMIN